MLLTLLAGVGQAGTVLYGIGPDGSGAAVGRRFFSISTTTPGSALWIDDIGPNSSRSVNGGLAYQPSDSQFYAVSNDSFGVGELVSFALTSPWSTTDVADLTTGFTWRGGLALGDGGLFYSIGTDATSAIPYFFSINPLTGDVTNLFALGDGSLGYYGGLTYDPSGRFFYALADGADGPLLRRIGLNGSVVTAAALDPGLWLGGVAYSGSGTFLALLTDQDAYAHLEQITPGAPTPVSEVYALWGPNNWGFWNAGLTLADTSGGGAGTGGGIPEPGTFGLAGLALAGLLGIFRRTTKC